MPNEAAWVEAKSAGRKAFQQGHPCVAPSLGYASLEASWRLGWKIEAGKSGLIIPKEH